MYFPPNIKDGDGHYGFYASTPDEDSRFTDFGERLYGIRGRSVGGSEILPNANGVSRRTYRADTYCTQHVTIDKADNTTSWELRTSYAKNDVPFNMMSSWFTEGVMGAIGGCEDCYSNCFGGCFDAFVGRNTCSNNCNSSCTGSTTTPSCNSITKKTNECALECVSCDSSCTGNRGCLMSCNSVQCKPCFYCVTDTTCNGCVGGCTNSCALSTANYTSRCEKSITAGDYTLQCNSCDGLTGSCNYFCNGTTGPRPSCVNACTTDCTTGCYSGARGECYKSCNTSCYGTCTTSCTAGFYDMNGGCWNTLACMGCNTGCNNGCTASCDTGCTAGCDSSCKREVGKTLSEHIRERRIEHAKYLLGFTDLQIQTVALHCGVLDVQYFTKMFKSQVGLTPSEYRTGQKQN